MVINNHKNIELMKKFLFVIAAAVAVSVVSCDKVNYKAMGEEYANKLEQLCEKNDTAGVVALDDSIRAIDADLVAQGDTAHLNAFRSGLRDVRDKVAPFITISKIESGVSKDDAVQEVINDVLDGSGGDVSTVTRSIQAALEQEKKKGVEQPEGKKPIRRRQQPR